MLSFKNNFFFTKFTVLFFILTIFGYWGIDLNSEELYIAFSFFLLVILGVLVSRKAALVLFAKLVNIKYFNFMSDLLIMRDNFDENVEQLYVIKRGLYKITRSIIWIRYLAVLSPKRGIFVSRQAIVLNKIHAFLLKKHALSSLVFMLELAQFQEKALVLSKRYSFDSYFVVKSFFFVN